MVFCGIAPILSIHVPATPPVRTIKIPEVSGVFAQRCGSGPLAPSRIEIFVFSLEGLRFKATSPSIPHLTQDCITRYISDAYTTRV